MLEPCLTLTYRPFQAPGAKGDSTPVSTGKMLPLFHLLVYSLPSLLKEEKIKGLQRLKCGRESGCVLCAFREQSKDQWVEIRDGEISAQQREGPETRSA